VRGIHHQIVLALGGQPLVHHATLVPQAGDALATEHAERGRIPVLIIDEAHLLDHPQLESIRMLTNHDIDSHSPFACLLVGQPTLRRRIKLGVLAALDQRIGLRYNMPPMTSQETGSYLRHHLGLAGRTDTLFSDDATTLIHQTSRGYPRAVNNLGAPRSAWSHPQYSWEELGRRFLDLMAYLDSKDEGDNSMPAKQRSRSGA
jgi:type II secretory pathway predicted ATPase ExeA